MIACDNQACPIQWFSCSLLTLKENSKGEMVMPRMQQEECKEKQCKKNSTNELFHAAATINF